MITAGTIKLIPGVMPQYTDTTLSATNRNPPTTPGSTIYNTTNGAMTIVGHGDDFWGGTQQGEFAYTTVPTDQAFDVAVHISSLVTNNTDGWSKSGIMVRADVSSNANVNCIFNAQTSGNNVSMQNVNTAAGNVQAGTAAPNWLRMSYDGTSLFSGYYYTGPATTTMPDVSDPSLWTEVTSFTQAMPGTTFELGIADTAHNNASTNTSVFDNLGNLFPSGPVNNLLPTTSGLTIGNGGSLDLNGVSQAVASLSDYTPGSGGNIFNSATATPTVLTLQPASGTSVFSGSIQGGGSLGAISLAVNGNGVQVLTGANTYTGSTTVNGGTLQIGNGGTTGSINATCGVVTNAILAFNRSDNISFAPAISGNGGVTQFGPGAVALTGSLSYTGQTTLVNAALTVGNAQNMTLAGAIVGSGTFSKAGAGTLTLGGYSTYSGPTVIVAGTVTVPQALQFQTAVLNVGGTTTPGSITAAPVPPIKAR